MLQLWSKSSISKLQTFKATEFHILTLKEGANTREAEKLESQFKVQRGKTTKRPTQHPDNGSRPNPEPDSTPKKKK